MLGLTASMILFYTYSRLLQKKEIGVTELAKIIETSKPNISQIIDSLIDLNYIENRPYKPVSLTNNGLLKADKIYRNVLILESFLFKTLSMPFFQCRNEAFRWEKDVYQSTIQTIKTKIDLQIGLLGDPFPTETGKMDLDNNFLNFNKTESGRPFKVWAIKNLQIIKDEYLSDISKIYLETVTAKNDTENKTVIIFQNHEKFVLPEKIVEEMLVKNI